MRLAAQAKMGYYPTPDKVTLIICRYLKRNYQGQIRILDPCAGNGTAIKKIGYLLKAETFGIELDTERGKNAKQVLNHCLITDYQNTRISKAAFSLLYLNPPYDFEAKEEDIEKADRYERTFLRDCIRYLCPKGVLVYLIPQRRLDSRIAGMLAYRFTRIRVFCFPEDEFRSADIELIEAGDYNSL